MRKGSKQGDRREEIDGRGGGGTSSARLCLEEEERELSERDKYQGRIRELKRLPTGQTGRTGLARANKTLSEKFSLAI